jgi:hypothetical protein
LLPASPTVFLRNFISAACSLLLSLSLIVHMSVALLYIIVYFWSTHFLFVSLFNNKLVAND